MAGNSPKGRPLESPNVLPARPRRAGSTKKDNQTSTADDDQDGFSTFEASHRSSITSNATPLRRHLLLQVEVISRLTPGRAYRKIIHEGWRVAAPYMAARTPMRHGSFSLWGRSYPYFVHPHNPEFRS